MEKYVPNFDVGKIPLTSRSIKHFDRLGKTDTSLSYSGIVPCYIDRPDYCLHSK